MRFKEGFAEAKSRFVIIQQNSLDLYEKLGMLSGPDVSPETLASLIAAFKSSTDGMDELLASMGAENERLTELLGALGEEPEPVSEAHEEIGEAVPEGVDITTYNELMMEKEALESRLKDAEERLDEKEQALKRLQAEHEALDAEYLILYQQRNSPQPDI
ncbi:MAG: hypothetical protein HGA78_01600 [Nitrospirales bacterium]|nr:hypothetical protein [Nitrospirales bacterium]